MSELEIRPTADMAPASLVDDPTGGRLVAWANAAQAANQLARALCTTTFVPRVKDRRTGEMVPISEGDATAQILMGDELGLSPLASLRSLFVVHGTPSMYARTMVALVQSKGHEVWTEAASDASVTVCGRRAGSEHVERSTWTTARAQKAKYTGNQKYTTNPQEMLYAKAAAEVCRRIAADVLAGVPATVEDFELEQPDTVSMTRSVEPAGKAQRRRKPASPEQPPAEPELEPAQNKDQETEPAAAGDSEFRSDTQMSKLWALAKTIGLSNADDFKAYLSQDLDRAVESTKTLTKSEASALIDQLEGLAADRDTGEIPGGDSGGQIEAV